ncbi:50S ribosomal protein L10 [Candidatus Woesearchaeota archaeon]|nr:50S ribosomal protein L10 [Candidatus Woesearchaeota archaeon]
MAYVSEHKKETVNLFVNLINESPIIGVVNMENIPAPQLQKIRKQLTEKHMILKMTKKRLMKIAFEKSGKKDIDKLNDYLGGIPALVFTKENPFKLSMILQENKSSAPAKPGQIATKPISVNAGPTTFTPGPVIGMLGKVGIKTGIEQGKIVIKEDTVVARKGDKISSELASILSRLSIEPMEIGLNLTAVYEDGFIFTEDLLTVSPKDYRDNIALAAIESLNLAFTIGYVSKETINQLLLKAYTDSSALASSCNIVTTDNIKDVIFNAYQNAVVLAHKVSGDKPKEQPEKDASEEKEKQDQQKEKKSDDDMAVGLGSLFG